MTHEITLPHHVQLNPTTFEADAIDYIIGVTQNGAPTFNQGSVEIEGIEIAINGGVPKPGRIVAHRVVNRGGIWRLEMKLKPEIRPLPPTGNVVGIDPGVFRIITTSKGLMVKPHPDIVRLDKRIQKLMNDRDSKHVDSTRYRELTRQIERNQLRLIDIQMNQFNEIADNLTKHNDVICIEDVDVNTGAIHDPAYLHAGKRARWDLLKRVIEYRCIETGRTFVLAPRWWSSQTCSECREYVQKSLDERLHHCPHCGFRVDRDVNGAREILNRGLEILVGSKRTDWHPKGHPRYVPDHEYVKDISRRGARQRW